MPDWIAYVRAKLGSTGLPAHREQEIAVELAGHLEDFAETNSNVDEQVPDWPAFARAIRQAEEDYMKSRLHTLWIPGLVTGILSAIALMMLQKAGLRPTIVWLHPAIACTFYLPWLLVLVPVGAVGAFWSRRAGGNARVRVFSAVFPILVFFIPVGIGGVIKTLSALIFDPGMTGFFALAVGATLATWVLAPGLALAAGSLPFLGSANQEEPIRSESAWA